MNFKKTVEQNVKEVKAFPENGLHICLQICDLRDSLKLAHKILGFADLGLVGFRD